jgi:hypothetical protein
MCGERGQARHELNAYGLRIEALTDACGLAWDDLHDPLGIAIPMICLNGKQVIVRDRLDPFR